MKGFQVSTTKMTMTFLEDLGVTRYHNPVSRLSKENGPFRSSGAYENGHAFVTRYPFVGVVNP